MPSLPSPTGWAYGARPICLLRSFTTSAAMGWPRWAIGWSAVPGWESVSAHRVEEIVMETVPVPGPTAVPAVVDDIIVCRDVHKWFGNFEALRGISMTVRAGEVVVIIGPSGS